MSSLRRFLLTRAFWNLGAFTLAVLIFLPSIVNAHLPAHFVLRARVLFVIGALLGLSTLLAAGQAFRDPETSPSIMASIVFFLFLGLELLVLGDVAQIFAWLTGA